MIRVATWNIMGHGARRSVRHLDAVVETIERLEADVVALQEVHRGTTAARGVDQLDVIASATRREARFGASLERDGGLYGNAILSLHPFIDTETISLPGRGEPRSLLIASVGVDATTITILATHLAAWGPLFRSTRRRQAEVALGYLCRDPRPALLLGDLNAPPGSRDLRCLSDASTVRSCLERSHVTHRWSRSCLDHIVTSRHWEIIRVEVVREGPSDHYPVVADLQMME